MFYIASQTIIFDHRCTGTLSNSLLNPLLQNQFRFFTHVTTFIMLNMYLECYEWVFFISYTCMTDAQLIPEKIYVSSSVFNFTFTGSCNT